MSFLTRMFSSGGDKGNAKKEKLSVRRQLQKLAIIAIAYYLVFGLCIASPLYAWVVLRPATGMSQWYTIDSILNIKREEFYFKSRSGEKLHGWLFRVPGTSRIAVVHHGNAGNLTNRLFLAKNLIEAGTSVFLYDYRGYGLSGGQPTLSGLSEDGLSAHDFVNRRLGFPAESIIVYGESIGSAVACRVAAARPNAALILQSGICCLPQVARDKMIFLQAYPIWVFPQPHFDNLAIIKQLREPVLFLHGEKDTLVSWRQSQELFDSAREPKTFVRLPDAGHNDVGDVNSKEYLEAVRSFVAKLPKQGKAE